MLEAVVPHYLSPFLASTVELSTETIPNGISIHLQPVVRTYSIPFKTIPSSALGQPTLDIGGRKGLTTPHPKSLSSRNSIRHHAQKKLK
jgi:hypothetical protein